MFKYILLILSCSILLSSDISVNGYIYDQSKNPIYNAEVYIKDISIGTVTDSLGYFNLLLDSIDDSFFLSVSHVAYKYIEIE